jgi:hypothetical protein
MKGWQPGQAWEEAVVKSGRYRPYFENRSVGIACGFDVECERRVKDDIEV